MRKNSVLRLLTIIALVTTFATWSLAQTSARPTQKQNPSPTARADENATEKASGISDAVDIVEGPKVDNVGKNSAVLEWKTNNVAATRVLYGTDQSKLTQHAYKPGGAREHRVELKNLKPGTTYFYSIENRAGQARFNGQFQTPAK